MKNLYKVLPLIISAAATGACGSGESNQAANQAAEASVNPNGNAATMPDTSNLSAPPDVVEPLDPAPQASAAPLAPEPAAESPEKPKAPSKAAPKSTPKPATASSDEQSAGEPAAEASNNTTAATCTPEHRAMGHC
jgi:hypothetical protein